MVAKCEYGKVWKIWREKMSKKSMTLREIRNLIDRFEECKFDLDKEIRDDDNFEFAISNLIYNKGKNKVIVKFVEVGGQ